MKIPFNIGNTKFFLDQYKTHQEKDILIMLSFDIIDFDSIFKILNFKSNYELSDDEKKLILYKFREISVGDEVNIKFVCECGQVNENVLELNNFIQEAKRNDSDIKKLNKKITDDNLQDFLVNDINTDELDIDEFEELKERIKQNQIHINFNKTSKCLKCNKLKLFDLSDTKYIMEIMSDDTLMTLYKTYNYLIFFGKYSKTDIDNMLPFERSIFAGLVNQTREDLNK